MARLIDVARAAGVSRSTASNVFNNPELVRTKLRQRVEAAARQLGYAGPDPKGRLLRAGKVNAIGLIPPGATGVASMFSGYFPRFLAGVAEVCDEHGASLTLVSGAGGDKTSGVRNALVDGFILSQLHEADLLEPLLRRNLPFVVIDNEGGASVNSVRADAYTGCRDAVRHLIALGHRRFAIMSFLRDLGPAIFHPPAHDRSPGIAGMPLDQEKFRGYTDGLSEVGIAIDAVPVVQAHPWDHEAAGLLLNKAPDATAVLSMSDMQAIRIMSEAQQRGLTISRDLSVVGYNDIPEAATARPPLTTIDAQGFEKGRAAARIVFHNGPPRHEILPTRLVVRASTGPAPGWSNSGNKIRGPRPQAQSLSEPSRRRRGVRSRAEPPA